MEEQIPRNVTLLRTQSKQQATWETWSLVALKPPPEKSYGVLGALGTRLVICTYYEGPTG